MDKDFWEHIRKGSDWAFSELYNEYAELLFGYGMKIANDEQMVSEAIQSLFVYLFERRNNLSCPNSIKAYLYASIKRILIRTMRKNRSSNFLSFDNMNQYEYSFDLVIDIESITIEKECTEEAISEVQKALNQLSPQQREVIYLKYYKSCSNDEIAEVLGITNPTVRNIASRALVRLRELKENFQFLWIITFL
ncbi:MAG: RNA polymerase sigma factor [Bacteroidales bacterium]